MRILLLALLLVFTNSVLGQSQTPTRPATTSPAQAKPVNPRQSANESQYVGQATPVVVEVLPAKNADALAKQQDALERKNAKSERSMVWATWALVGITGILAWYTASLWRATVKLGKHAEATSLKQGMEMQASIAEANRAARAIEELAKSAAINSVAATESVTTLKDRTVRQMRAYMCAEFYGALPQDSVESTKFEGRVWLVNTGNTPAHKVSSSVKAAILPNPLPDDFDFPLSARKEGGLVLGPGQKFFTTAVVDDYCPDVEVEGTKRAANKALFIWGIADYEDIFSEKRSTSFCLMVAWTPEATCFYTTRHNVAS